MGLSKLIFTLVSFLVILDANSTGATVCSIVGDGSRLALLISPILTEQIAHEIEIQWYNLSYQAGDELAVYKQEPSPNATPIYKMALESASGCEKTGLSAEFIPSEKLTFKQQCLGYHVAWLRDSFIKRTDCLKTRPNWMAERRNILGPRKMTEVFLPGTHDSGSYAIHTEPDTPDYFQKYAITQDIDVLGQLIYGVRYLDIRVAYYRQKEDPWWVVHGLYHVVPLRTVIDQVKTFLNNTEEIVIFDMQEFGIAVKGNRSLHHDLIQYLEREFADYISDAMFQWSTDLETIWASRKRLIIGYDDYRMTTVYKKMWKSVMHQWGDVRNINDLFRYLSSIETHARIEDRKVPRSAMAELTANAVDVIFDRLGGLRKMAERVNFNVTNSYSTLWQDSANIVAVDFVRSSGIVDVAIDANDKRFAPCTVEIS